MCNEEYIALHREEDIRPLALRKAPEGVDMLWCLQQIEVGQAQAATVGCRGRSVVAAQTVDGAVLQ